MVLDFFNEKMKIKHFHMQLSMIRHDFELSETFQITPRWDSFLDLTL